MNISKEENKKKKYIEMLEINVFSLEPTTGIEPVTSSLPTKIASFIQLAILLYLWDTILHIDNLFDNILQIIIDRIY